MTTTINASTSSGLVTTPDNSGAIALQNNGTTGLNIDASGRVTMPLQPALYRISSLGGAQSGYGTTPAKIAVWNTGSNLVSKGGLTWDTANSRCVVPVAGLYQLYSRITVDGATAGGADDWYQPYINGSIYGNTSLGYGNGYQAAGLNYYRSYYSSQIMNLNANDYVEMWVKFSAGSYSLYGQMCTFQLYLVG